MSTRVSILSRLRSGLEALVMLVLLAAVLAALWAFGRARLSAEAYALRLEALCADYEVLRQDYNRAIARTAVTELQVRDNRVSVLVRTADGAIREVPTACRADREVYVDYVVLGGRLWIRRVFDAGTAPEAGTLIDPALAGVPWEADAATVGKAVYRRLQEGRWVVTVTGNGALGLEAAASDAEVALVAAPAVADFTAVEAQLRAAQAGLSWRDVLRAAVRRRPGPAATPPG